MKVLLVVPYPQGVAASQRFRVEQWLPMLREQGIRYKLAPFWRQNNWLILYQPGHTLQKALGFLIGMIRRFLLLFRLSAYDYVFIHREATPLGPPWFEWLAANIFRKKIVYDFDDAIWLPNTTAGNQIAARYKQHQKVSGICRWSYKVSCGNSYLQAFAQQYNPTAVYLPTCIDTERYHNQLKQQHTQRVVIGWTGSHSTLPYLSLIEPVMQRLEQQYDFDFLVIADKKPALRLRSMKFILWQKQTEIEDLLQINIGLMPLPDTEWAKGKCAFKALQYMALGIPAVVSAVGANMVVVPDGEAGYTCTLQQEWYERLDQLLLQPALRTEMGQKGRAWVETHYSVQAQQHTFLNLFT